MDKVEVKEDRIMEFAANTFEDKGDLKGEICLGENSMSNKKEEIKTDMVYGDSAAVEDVSEGIDLERGVALPITNYSHPKDDLILRWEKVDRSLEVQTKGNQVFEEMLEQEVEIGHSHSNGCLYFGCKGIDGRLEIQKKANQLFEKIPQSHSTKFILRHHYQVGIDKTMIKTSFDSGGSILLNLDYNRSSNDSYLNETEFAVLENMGWSNVNDGIKNKDDIDDKFGDEMTPYALGLCMKSGVEVQIVATIPLHQITKDARINFYLNIMHIIHETTPTVFAYGPDEKSSSVRH
ncbi:hypothetical protein ACH5RR_014601 [Cinchona calisaya]|uniref:Uncharacterized protein n=1 Tax=Cinchona calisaya TaxID=153742 RepID=A0ABD3A3A9_9GENT